MMATETITTRTAKIWLRDDGVIQFVILPGIKIQLADAKENAAAVAQLAADQRRPVLVDIRASLGIDHETRAYYAKAEGVKSNSALALLVESPVTRVMANFFISINKPVIPTQLFTSEAEAVMWLKNFVEAPSSPTVRETEG
jgi:hypothetical protein